jgi:hypothetical protein
MTKRKSKREDNIPEDELAAALRRELTVMERAMGAEVARLDKQASKRAKSKKSGAGIQQATLRCAMGDLDGAVEILRKAVAAADESMGEREPYRFYMHAAFADWVSELGVKKGLEGAAELEEARRHMEVAWKFVTTEEAGKVYLEEVRERKTKVDGRVK